MAINERLRKALEQGNVPYAVLPHREVFTAQETAEASHVPGGLLAKPIVIRLDEGRYCMVVVTAPQHVDLSALHPFTGQKRGRLATEAELAGLFPDCELGAMPPIGHLYGMPTYLDEEFRRHDDICFQAGNHHEVVKMRLGDFEKVAGPFAGESSLHREASKFGG
jgi:Ala-tRNA(Pro) deacylase